MPRPALDSEDALEQATLRLFEQLGWQTVNCFDEVHGDAPAVRTIAAEAGVGRDRGMSVNRLER